MKLSLLREMYDTRPFVPFTLTLTDGRKLQVIHNEFLAFFPTGRAVMVVHPDERWTMVDLAHISAVDADPAYATRKPKARGKKR